MFRHQFAALKLKPTPSRHRFEKPIHNVKKAGSCEPQILPRQRQISVLHHLDILASWLRTLAPSVAAKLRLVAAIRSRWPR
jgi:hypothetical protein